MFHTGRKCTVIAVVHRVYSSPLIFASCRDCPSYVASAETVQYILFPAENNAERVVR